MPGAERPSERLRRQLDEYPDDAATDRGHNSYIDPDNLNGALAQRLRREAI